MVSIQRMLKSRWWRFPITWWWRSLPLRVVLTVFVASVLVLVLGGFLLMQQATIGVIDGKKETAKSAARQAVNTAQQQLNAADLTGDVNVDKLLLDHACESGAQVFEGTRVEEVLFSEDGRRARGVRAMLPYVDEFRPVHNLNALADLCAALGSRSPAGVDPRRFMASDRRAA